jgi:hypothetical protein
VPLSLLENEWRKEFFQKLRPSFKLPSRYQLSNKLLDNEYKSVQEKVKQKIQSSETLTLLSDGWTDINGTALINILFTTPEPVFYTSIDSKLERHTGEYICSILSQAIDEVDQDKITAVITDNAANMKLAWRLLKDKYPTLITYGCQAGYIQFRREKSFNYLILKTPYLQNLRFRPDSILGYMHFRPAVPVVLNKIY